MLHHHSPKPPSPSAAHAHLFPSPPGHACTQEKYSRSPTGSTPEPPASSGSHTPARESYAAAAFQTPRSSPQEPHAAAPSSPIASSWPAHTTHPPPTRSSCLTPPASSTRSSEPVHKYPT